MNLPVIADRLFARGALLGIMLSAAVLAAPGTTVSAATAAALDTAAAPAPHPSWASEVGTDPYGHWADLTVASISQRLRWIAPGSLTMGSPVGEPGRDPDEVPHAVRLTTGLWLGDTDVTQALWQAVVAGSPSRVVGTGQTPIEGIAWKDCQAFCAKLNALKPGLGATLPSEAQWEYACRAGGAPMVPLEAYAWFAYNSGNDVHPVKQKKPNAWGLYDMLGNVWQPCGDWYGDYAAGPATDPAGPPSGINRVYRGGSYNSSPICCRPSWRGGEGGAIRHNLGLRFAVPASPSPPETR
jgi:formylglycine-generating enzyme required for sulfatase activity